MYVQKRATLDIVVFSFWRSGSTGNYTPTRGKYGLGIVCAFCLSMNIEEINRKHFIKTDMFFRVGKGLSSNLIKYEHGIIYLELEVRVKWKLSIDAAAHTIAHSWRNENEEFSQAIASKVFIIDSRSFAYKRTLIHLGIKPGFDAYKGVFFR